MNFVEKMRATNALRRRVRGALLFDHLQSILIHDWNKLIKALSHRARTRAYVIQTLESSFCFMFHFSI